MQAQVVTEMNVLCSSASYCDVCNREISEKEACYHCRVCEMIQCTMCTRMAIGLPHQPVFASGDPLDVNIGDIFLCGPDRYGIHHVILACGQILPAYRELPCLELQPGVEAYSIRTIESTQALKGEDTWWYSTTCFFQRDPYTGEAALIADIPPHEDVINTAETPIPMKVLRHPLRDEDGELTMDTRTFNDVVLEAAAESRTYGWSTAVRSYIRTQFDRHFLDPAKYPDEHSRIQLMKKLHKQWSKKPICASVAIKVWQMYFAAACEDQDEAARTILELMPLKCHATMPSSMVQVLTNCGWTLHESLNA